MYFVTLTLKYCKAHALSVSIEALNNATNALPDED